ncbi:M56 family metallopeptidase [Hymenobacter guriensis]|uniref:M48 family metalloprotease n=1 Tax=Hymenobacter guriensis TaxID=2793065 RepID=A0ABS0KXS6_9BACT|nr:M56 family metallopeptidase [Hymenobacter guriensis]MBG8552654.1 M48 family metalloprotease [Hymenobacter guriensis]
MNWLEQTLSPALVRALGWTLVHSLWQGAVVALALGGLLLVLRRHTATVRYRVAGLALGTMLLLASVTFGRYYYAALVEVPSSFQASNDANVRLASWQATGTPTIAPTEAPALVVADEDAPLGPLAAWQRYFDQNLPVLVTAWLLGLLAMTLRLLGGLAYVQRLRHYRVQPLGVEWQHRLGALADKANLQRPVALLESALVRVPMVVGHLKPAILLPLGTVTGLSNTYLEAILAHELAHVARRDYLMNLVQSVAEILFFYHPAVWFVTATMRVERENCCDDTATALVGGNPLTLARALTALAELNLSPRLTPQLAMAAVGSRGTLLGRVRRLVQGRTAPTFTEGFMAACVVLGGLMLLTTAVALADPRPLTHPRNPLGNLLPDAFTSEDTTKQQSTSTTSSTSTETTTPLVAKVPAEVEATDETPADEKPHRKGTRSRSSEQVVIVDGASRRFEPGQGASTVVIEKDKKGRVTNLTVNGQPVETAARPGKKAKTSTQVIRVAPNGYVMRNEPNEVFQFQFGNAPSPQVWMQVPNQRDMATLRQLSRAQAEREKNRFWLKRGSQGHTFYLDGTQSFGDNKDWTEVTDEALRQAELKLNKAYREADSEEEKEQIQEARERLQEQRAELRERLADARQEADDDRNSAQERQFDEAMRLHDEAMREYDREMRELDDDMRGHDETMRLHDEAMREHDKEMLRADEARRADNKVEEALSQQMLNDGLIKNRNNYQLNLNAREMTVNGKKLPTTVRDKYLRLFTAKAGRKLTTGSFVITRRSNSTSRSYVSPPAPPRPPQVPRAPQGFQAPRAPQAPRAADAPAPPAPPAPPRLDSNRIRQELRKDGLLGATEKSFQFQLNDDGLSVNGKTQSAEMARKYRRMLDMPEPTAGRKNKQTFQISVSE